MVLEDDQMKDALSCFEIVEITVESTRGDMLSQSPNHTAAIAIYHEKQK